jgi:hypothetical protein
VQTDTHSEPLHQRILVPLGALIALAAGAGAVTAIALVVTAPQDLTRIVTDGGAASLFRGVAVLIVDAVWSLVSSL